jgi:Fe-S cluster assembly ATP-binding protein
MGPNGAGKSTLSYVLAGRAGYEVTGGSVTFDGQDLLALAPHERAAAGVFLGLQYPVEIPGVSNLMFLRTALNAQRTLRGEKEASGAEFMKLAKAAAEDLGLPYEMLKRSVNQGFSGGEKKRNEMVQMAVLEPKLALLDETDSGLDIDALRVVSEGINRMRSPDRATLLITHYQRLLDYVVPDYVHVLVAGRIVRTGGPELAQELERDGYQSMAA